MIFLPSSDPTPLDLDTESDAQISKYDSDYALALSLNDNFMNNSFKHDPMFMGKSIDDDIMNIAIAENNHSNALQFFQDKVHFIVAEEVSLKDYVKKSEKLSIIMNKIYFEGNGVADIWKRIGNFLDKKTRKNLFSANKWLEKLNPKYKSQLNLLLPLHNPLRVKHHHIIIHSWELYSLNYNLLLITYWNAMPKLNTIKLIILEEKENELKIPKVLDLMAKLPKEIRSKIRIKIKSKGKYGGEEIYKWIVGHNKEVEYVAKVVDDLVYYPVTIRNVERRFRWNIKMCGLTVRYY